MKEKYENLHLDGLLLSLSPFSAKKETVPIGTVS
jgi:hypothetical protein